MVRPGLQLWRQGVIKTVSLSDFSSPDFLYVFIDSPQFVGYSDALRAGFAAFAASDAMICLTDFLYAGVIVHKVFPAGPGIVLLLG